MSDTNTVNYPERTFHYAPNQPAAIIAGVMYGLLSAILFARVFRSRNWWALCLPIGTTFFSIGFFLRYGSATDPTSKIIYILSQVLLIVSPAAFIAFNYVVYGRMMQAFTSDRPGFTLIRPQIVARIFVTSDILTFLVQGGGSALLASDDLANTGRIILLLGIIGQAASYLFFYVLLGYSHYKLSSEDKNGVENLSWTLLYVLHFSSVFILVRAVYRSIEMAEGTGGYVATHEVFFYMLDTVPLFLATAVYANFWPGDLIRACISPDYSTTPMHLRGNANREV